MFDFSVEKGRGQIVDDSVVSSFVVLVVEVVFVVDLVVEFVLRLVVDVVVVVGTVVEVVVVEVVVEVDGSVDGLSEILSVANGTNPLGVGQIVLVESVVSFSWLIDDGGSVVLIVCFTS